MRSFRTSAATRHEFYKGRHRFEHWYRDNTVYFITSRCRDRFPAFDCDEAKLIFWDRFHHYTSEFGFTPWVTTLLNNHYHTLGHLRVGENLGPMMQRLHGSVAKLVNDLLPARHLPFWRRVGNQDYFDGCIRDVLQARRAISVHAPAGGASAPRAPLARPPTHPRERPIEAGDRSRRGTERVPRIGPVRTLRA